MSDVNLAVGQPSTGTPGLQVASSSAPISPVVFHDFSVTNADPTIASVSVDASGVLSIVALAPGTTTVIVSGQADYTDPNGTSGDIVNKAVTADAFAIIVTAVVTPTEVKLVYTFA